MVTDLDEGLFLHVDLRPASQPERGVLDGLELYGPAALPIDRGCLSRQTVHELRAPRTVVTAKAWSHHRPGRFAKRDFTFNFEARPLTPSAG